MKQPNTSPNQSVPQSGLSFYEIVNNPRLLQKMTCEEGEDLTETEQMAKLDRLIKRKKVRVEPNPLEDL